MILVYSRISHMEYGEPMKRSLYLYAKIQAYAMHTKSIKDFKSDPAVCIRIYKTCESEYDFFLNKFHFMIFFSFFSLFFHFFFFSFFLRCSLHSANFRFVYFFFSFSFLFIYIMVYVYFAYESSLEMATASLLFVMQ